MKVLTADIPVC